MFAVATKNTKLGSERRQYAGTAAFCSVSHAGDFPKTLTDISIQRKSSCACGGGCPACQEKSSDLRVSRPNDPAESEADQIAERVMRMPVNEAALGGINTNAAPQTIHPNCSSGSGGAPVSNSISDKINSSRGGGSALDQSTRSFFEPRFGADLGGVRVHTGGHAAELSRDLSAKAFTVGSDIYFSEGQYQPNSQSGKDLLAHELTHFVQQGSGYAAPAIQRDGEPGTSVYSEHSDVTVTSAAKPNVWTGTVRREERTASGTLIHTGRAPVRYDENACSVTIPLTVSFRNATLADVQNCPPHLNQPAPTTLPAAVSSDVLRSIADRYIQTLNEDLNGWYTVTFDGCESNRCHGRDMPIQVQVTEASAGARADYEVAIANREGRSCVDDSNYRTGGTGTVLLYAQGLERGTMAHEGGHMALGHGDEYREEEQPGPARPEDRVREGDWSRMGSHASFGRFSLMHERHFQFVPFFLNQVRPGCNARLVEMTRPPQIDVTIELGVGYASFAGLAGRTGGLYYGLGVSLGVPLSRQREWEMIVGLQGRFLAELEERNRLAFLLGVRLGLEHTFSPSSGGFTTGGFGEAGVGWMPGGFGGYAEGGGYLGYTPPPLSGGLRIPLRVEGAVGIAAPAVGRIGEPGMAAPTDPESLRYFRLGLSAAFRF